MTSKAEPQAEHGPSEAVDVGAAPGGFAPAAPALVSIARVVALQRTAGNAAVGRLLSTIRPPPARVIQRSPGELSATDLFLQVMFRASTVAWSIPRDRLDAGLITLLEGDKTQIAAIETAITAALNPAGQPIHETTVYLMSPPVFEDLVKDVNGWPAARAMPLLSARLTERSQALQATACLYPVEQELEKTGIDPASIDWPAQVAALKAAVAAADQPNVIEAAHADRYEAVVARLGDEAAKAHPEAGAGTLQTEAIRRYVWDVMTAEGAAGPLASEAMQHAHSEKFLATWLPIIQAIKLVPDGFDLETFRPPADGAADRQRDTLLGRFIAEAAPQAMTSFLLDRWAADPAGRNPEQYIKTADIAGLREALLDDLATQFMRWAETQPGFTGAMWSDAGQKSAFDALTLMVAAGRATHQFNAGLHDRFLTANRAQLNDEEWGIASDPAGYADRLTKLSLLTQPLLAGLKPGGGFVGSLLGWWETAGAALGGGPEGGFAVGLLAVFNAIGNVKSVVEAQKAAAKEGLRKGLDTSFETITSTIRDEAQFAATFIKDEWIPMLKLVATERITANKRELEAQLADWEGHRAQAAAKFRIVGHLLDDLIAKFEGDTEEAELDGQTMTKADLPELRTARDFVNGQAQSLTDPDKAQKKKSDIQKAVDGFGDVLENIQNGGYAPLDYSSAVYEEARQRLGIGWYRDFTTVGQALSRFEVASENPFVAFAITRWKWNEQQERLGAQFAVFIGLGLLTVASLLAPGVGGLVIGGLDLALGVGMGIHQVATADDIVDLARLDTDGAVAGISVEQAEKALKTAWIGLGVSAVLAAGIGALWSRIVFKAIGGASKVPSSLTRLSALMRVDAVAAEAIIGKVKDVEKAEHLLEITGDSVLLGRMLDKTQELKHLEFALMHGQPAKVAELLDLAGDAGTLAKILDHAQIEPAERVLRLADDAKAAASLLEKASTNEIAIALLEWTKGSTGSITRLAGEGNDVDRLWRLSRAMDTAKLDELVAKGHTLAELDELVKGGTKAADFEAGIGLPSAAGAAPATADARVALPQPVITELANHGIADAAVLQTATPHEADRLLKVFRGGITKRAGDEFRHAAGRWAVNGANDPGEVVARYEYLKTRWDEIRTPLTSAAYPNQSLDRVAGRILGQELQMGQLDAQLASDIERVQSLVGSGWRPLSGIGDSASMVKAIANELTFGTDTLTAYHVRKHADELSLAEQAVTGAGFDAQLATYIGSARRTIATGTATVEGETVTFVRTVTDSGGVSRTMTARVYIRDGHALITTYGGKRL